MLAILCLEDRTLRVEMHINIGRYVGITPNIRKIRKNCVVGRYHFCADLIYYKEFNQLQSACVCSLYIQLCKKTNNV